MLQQTRAQVVIPYFLKWMERFPNIELLARAPLEEVIKTWEGLGYYSRARNLHEGAKTLVEEFGGKLPSTREELKKIKGVGPYTMGAILSFAFRQKAAAVDGNVLRVLSRFFAIEDSIDLPATRRRIEELAEGILPEKEPWIMMEALIELGALVCQKKPECSSCPLNESCLAFRHHIQEALPRRSKGAKTIHLRRWVGIVEYEGKILVSKGERGKVMADLYEFPYLEEEGGDPTALFSQKLELSLSLQKKLDEEIHTFTRYRATLIPFLFRAEESNSRFCWIEKKKLSKLPFSSGHRRVLQQL